MYWMGKVISRRDGCRLIWIYGRVQRGNIDHQLHRYTHVRLFGNIGVGRSAMIGRFLMHLKNDKSEKNRKIIHLHQDLRYVPNVQDVIFVYCKSCACLRILLKTNFIKISQKSPSTNLFQLLMESDAVTESLLVGVKTRSESLPQSVKSLGGVSNSLSVYVPSLH